MTNKFIPGQMYKDRDGREYMFVGYALNTTPAMQAVFTLGVQIVGRTLEGKAALRDYDILIEKDVWVNVYRDAGYSTGVRCSIATYASEELAKKGAGAGSLKNYLFSQKITVEV